VPLLGQRLCSEGEEPTLTIERKLGVKEQADADHADEHRDGVAPNPRRTSQASEEHENLRREKSTDGGQQDSPMLKEGLQTVALAMRIHSGLTI